MIRTAADAEPIMSMFAGWSAPGYKKTCFFPLRGMQSHKMKVPSQWGNRSNFVALNVVPAGPAEMSIYHRNGHRYVMRTDGFVSARAGATEGELITRPLIFSGKELLINYSTSAGGRIQVEILEVSGLPVSGFHLEDCIEITGDEIEREVRWMGDPDLEELAGKPVRLRFVMKECDLYSFRFR